VKPHTKTKVDDDDDKSDDIEDIEVNADQNTV